MTIDIELWPDKIKSVKVSSEDGVTGLLSQPDAYAFTYGEGSADASVTMPFKPETYYHGALHPIFEMNLPEGYVRRYLEEKLQRHCRINDMLFLAIQGKGGVGRLQYLSQLEVGDRPRDNLNEILKWNGNESIFPELLERHLLFGTLSGMQPKVLVQSDQIRSSLLRPDLIVKTGGIEYPHLALNEYVCLKIAKEAGLNVPDFWLSDNQDLLVVERFDIKEDKSLGMEDFCVLMKLHGEQRYSRSYEMAGKVVNIFTQDHTQTILFFEYVAMCCLLGNGDGHLKNFSILYDHPKGERWLSPLYDVVCTEMYPDEDGKLALKMNKSKTFPDKKGLLDFAKSLNIKDAKERLEKLADTLSEQIRTMDLLAGCPELKQSLQKSLDRGMSLNASFAGYTGRDTSDKPRKVDQYLKQ